MVLIDFRKNESLYTKYHRSYKKISVITKEIHFKFRIQVKYLKTYNNTNSPDQFYYIHFASLLLL